jgi:hypothetical protein
VLLNRLNSTGGGGLYRLHPIEEGGLPWQDNLDIPGR